MNKVTLIGRLTRDPNVRYSQNGAEPLCIARYTLAVDRRRSRNDGDQQTADFIDCVAFGRTGEFAEKYLHKGTKIAINGRIQTGSYTNREGQKVYTTEVVVEDHEFVESRNASSGGYGGGNNYGNGGGSGYGGGNYGNGGGNNYNGGSQSNGSYGGSQSGGSDGGYQNQSRQNAPAQTPQNPADDFMNIPDGIDEELPFN